MEINSLFKRKYKQVYFINQIFSRKNHLCHKKSLWIIMAVAEVKTSSANFLLCFCK